MHEEDVGAVLRCSLCNKPFNKQSTLKRHGYYCRSRRAAGTTRSRSCISCIGRKARCDNRQPKCSRCTTKAIECQYPAGTPKGAASSPQHNSDVWPNAQDIAPLSAVDPLRVGRLRDSSNDGDISVDNRLTGSDTDFVNLEWDDIDWDDSMTDLTTLLEPQTSSQHASPDALLLPDLLGPSADVMAQLQGANSSSSPSIPPIPPCSIRLLVGRPNLKTGPQRIATLMFHTLKSYPQMMLRHSTLPPFVHPGLVSSDIENSYMEPLTNCISLVHMTGCWVQGSRKLFWKNVRLECERIRGELVKYTKWELLAAMQALAIYILMRLDEGETDHNNFDYLLQATVRDLAKQIMCKDTKCNTNSALCSYGRNISWLDWIYEESRRRISVIYRVVNMLVYFEPASMCNLQKDLVLAPLPAKKQLWEAGDESMWKVESERQLGAQHAFGLAATGDLVKLNEGQLYCTDAVLRYKSLSAKIPSRKTAYWEEWCSGMDGFGGLVMLAASLIE